MALREIGRQFNGDLTGKLSPQQQREILSVAMIMASERVKRDRQGFQDLLAEWRCRPTDPVETFFDRC